MQCTNILIRHYYIVLITMPCNCWRCGFQWRPAVHNVNALFDHKSPLTTKWFTLWTFLWTLWFTMWTGQFVNMVHNWFIMWTGQFVNHMVVNHMVLKNCEPWGSQPCGSQIVRFSLWTDMILSELYLLFD